MRICLEYVDTIFMIIKFAKLINTDIIVIIYLHHPRFSVKRIKLTHKEQVNLTEVNENILSSSFHLILCSLKKYPISEIHNRGLPASLEVNVDRNAHLNRRVGAWSKNFPPSASV